MKLHGNPCKSRYRCSIEVSIDFRACPAKCASPVTATVPNDRNVRKQSQPLAEEMCEPSATKHARRNISKPGAAHHARRNVHGRHARRNPRERSSLQLGRPGIPRDAKKGMIGALGIPKGNHRGPRGSKQEIIGALGIPKKKGMIGALGIPKRGS